jgi:hypothetical protein
VLVSHDTRRVSVWQRDADGWSEHTVTGSAVVELSSVGCHLSLDEIYRDPLQAN